MVHILMRSYGIRTDEGSILVRDLVLYILVGELMLYILTRDVILSMRDLVLYILMSSVVHTDDILCCTC